ncbi:MAG: phage tail protein [Gammaproteobacteria bacterium]|nr:phage tail protein [Gammaproteobacteria bacterium]
MLALGQFVFSLHTLPHQELQRQYGWRHPSTSRIGLRPARQFLGPDDESVNLSGVLLPEITGGPKDLDLLRAMGDQGKAWPLVDGEGTVLGVFVIDGLSETRSVFFSDGTARRIEFNLSLKRVDDERAALGQLTPAMRSLI